VQAIIVKTRTDTVLTYPNPSMQSLYMPIRRRQPYKNKNG
jgi:hypothetical protein